MHQLLWMCVACQCLYTAKSPVLPLPSFLLLSVFLKSRLSLPSIAKYHHCEHLCLNQKQWNLPTQFLCMSFEILFIARPVADSVLVAKCIHIQGKSVRVVNHLNLPLNLVNKMLFLPYRFQRSPFPVGNAVVIVKWQQWGCPCATLSESSDVCIRGSWLWGAWCESCFRHCQFCHKKCVVVSLQNSANPVNVPDVKYKNTFSLQKAKCEGVGRIQSPHWEVRH